MRAFSPIAFLLAYSLFGQTLQVPYDPLIGTTFTIQQVGYIYQGAYSSIQAVDFRNLTLRHFDSAGRPFERLPLKNGSHRHSGTMNRSTMSLDAVHYLGRSALVLCTWFAVAGSSSQGGIAYVFTVSNRHLRVIQAIEWDTHFSTKEPMESFDPGTNELVIRTSHYIPGDAHCCVSAMDSVTLRWDGARFIKERLQTELTEYGKTEGKALPQ